MSLGLLFGLPPPPIFVVPGCTAVTSGLAWAWRVLAFPALGWPARRDVLCWGHGLRHFPGFLSLGARLDAVDPAREPVPFGAPVTPSLSFDSRLAAVSAEAAGLGFGEFLPCDWSVVFLFWPRASAGFSSLYVPSVLSLFWVFPVWHRLFSSQTFSPCQLAGSDGKYRRKVVF